MSKGLFTNIRKACAMLRPDPPPKKIEWSLSKVLEKAAWIEVNCKYLTTQTRKTAFLLSLASAARISELTAFGRGNDFIKFLNDGAVKISMVKTFLAKNEDPSNR